MWVSYMFLDWGWRALLRSFWGCQKMVHRWRH